MTIPRGSSAVMAMRAPAALEELSLARKLHYFPTPPWAYRALIHEVLSRPSVGLIEPAHTVWEPACGGGHGAIPLAETQQVFATDVHDWGFGDLRNVDFTMAPADVAPFPIDWVITNPPFKMAEQFVLRALEIVRVGVAMLVRVQWLEGEDRYRSIWNAAGDAKPLLVCPFAERVPMIEAAWDPEASSATAYAWVIWTIGGKGDADAWRRPEVLHIPPGMELRYTTVDDERLALRGEAERRRLQKAAP